MELSPSFFVFDSRLLVLTIEVTGDKVDLYSVAGIELYSFMGFDIPFIFDTAKLKVKVKRSYIRMIIGDNFSGKNESESYPR